MGRTGRGWVAIIAMAACKAHGPTTSEHQQVGAPPPSPTATQPGATTPAAVGDTTTPAESPPRVWKWSEPVQLDANKSGTEGDQPSIVTDRECNALAVWRQFASNQADVMARRFDAKATKWGPIVQLDRARSGVGQLSIAMQPAGDAVVVWDHVRAGAGDVLAARFDGQTGAWTVAASIEPGKHASSSYPRVAISAAGDAIAVWERDRGGRFDIYAGRLDAKRGAWDVPVPIEGEGGGNGRAASVAFDRDGNAIAMWEQHDGKLAGVHANDFDAATGRWTGAVHVHAASDSGFASPEAVLLDGRAALAVWAELGGNVDLARFSRRDARTRLWTAPTALAGAGVGDASGPSIAVDGHERATLAWQQRDAKSMSIMARRFDTRSDTWTDPVLLEARDDSSASSSRIAVDAAGNAVAVWEQGDHRHSDVYANRFDVDAEAWGEATLLDSGGEGTARSIDVASCDSGVAIAVWAGFDGSHRGIWARHLQ